MCHLRTGSLDNWSGCPYYTSCFIISVFALLFMSWVFCIRICAVLRICPILNWLCKSELNCEDWLQIRNFWFVNVIQHDLQSLYRNLPVILFHWSVALTSVTSPTVLSNIRFTSFSSGGKKFWRALLLKTSFQWTSLAALPPLRSSSISLLDVELCESFILQLM